MKIVISPAKTLDFETELPIQRHTQPTFLAQAKKVHKVLKAKKPKDLMQLMAISDKLADQNSNVVPEFMEFVNQLKPKLDSADANKLEAFTQKLSKVDRNAQKGVDALYELSRNQRKMSTESLRDIEELELELK